MITSPVMAEKCDGPSGGTGTKVVGVDGHSYCRSNIKMNWWSAFAWCEGIGKTLVSLEDCNGIDGSVPASDVACPNFDHKGSGDVWTSSVPRNDGAYRITLSSGAVVSCTPSVGCGRHSTTYALCK